MKVVRPVISRSMPSTMRASVSLSMALVGSSRIRIGASLRKARAMAIRWRSPPDSLVPRSPTGVS
jgi:hypothetical protein